MDTKAKLTAINKNYSNGHMQLVIEVEADKNWRKVADKTMRLVGKDVNVRLVKYSPKRSLEANSYFWKLCSMMAEVLNTSNQEVHNLMLQRYGQYEFTENGVSWRVLPDDQKPNEDEYLQPTANTVQLKTKKGTTVGRVYLVMRGSSTYDSAEMFRLIRGTADEAEELGIDTRTPEEIERMAQQWGVKE